MRKHTPSPRLHRGSTPLKRGDSNATPFSLGQELKFNSMRHNFVNSLNNIILNSSGGNGSINRS
ncbi:MAG: hypothetical protein CO189_00260 [candidate division Zixibacteria bacterium CG_4_9_14_3_um_filter_46_8]|nr:MAG: hypothetical protein CO189_00260 [candidate division Zixibacteria bacterium CG_4_9_14_3_um_filter_46_8]